MSAERYIILADVTCDLSEQIRDRIDMKDYVKGHIHFDDGRDFPTTLDWTQISRADFYKQLSNRKTKISTAPSNAEEYFEIFENYIRKGYGIISMSLSSAISTTYNQTCIAADRLRKQYPDCKVYCFDSSKMSGAFGLLTIYAHRMQQEGKSFEEVVAWLEENKFKVHQMGPIDDLIFVARRGRLTMGKAIMGNFAGVKPMGDCNSEGYTTVLTKVKGIGKALDVTVQYAKETAVDIENQIVLIAHSDRELYARTLEEKIREALSPKDVWVTDVFSACGANVGPGMVGIYYLGDRVSDDMSKEKEIITHIQGK